MKNIIWILIITLLIIVIMIFITFYFLFYGPSSFTILGKAVPITSALTQ